MTFLIWDALDEGLIHGTKGYRRFCVRWVFEIGGVFITRGAGKVRLTKKGL
jgi:hypothetical protein